MYLKILKLAKTNGSDIIPLVVLRKRILKRGKRLWKRIPF